MNDQTILIYGPANSGKSIFIKRIKGIEENEIPKADLKKYPTVYVINKPNPDNFTLCTVVLRFTEHGEVIFEKGFDLII